MLEVIDFKLDMDRLIPWTELTTKFTNLVYQTLIDE